MRFARNGQRIIDAGFREDESFVHNIVRLLGAPALDAEVHFLAPVAAMPDARRRMADQARERIMAALEDPQPAEPRA